MSYKYMAARHTPKNAHRLKRETTKINISSIRLMLVRTINKLIDFNDSLEREVKRPGKAPENVCI